MEENNSKTKEAQQKASGYATSSTPSSYSLTQTQLSSSRLNTRKPIKNDPVLEAQLSSSLANKGKGLRAIVVGEITLDTLICQTLPDDRDSRFLVCYGRESIGDYFYITEICPFDGELRDLLPYKVFKKNPIETNRLGEKMTLAVVEVFNYGVIVVGDTIDKPILVARRAIDPKLYVGDFLLGEVIALDANFKPVMMAERVCYVKDFKAERQYIEDYDMFMRNREGNKAPQKPEVFYFVKGLSQYSEVLLQEFRQHHNLLQVNPLAKTPYEIYKDQKPNVEKRLQDFLAKKNPPKAPPSGQNFKSLDIDVTKSPPIIPVKILPPPSVNKSIPPVNNAPMVGIPAKSPLSQPPPLNHKPIQFAITSTKSEKSETTVPLAVYNSNFEQFPIKRESILSHYYSEVNTATTSNATIKSDLPSLVSISSTPHFATMPSASLLDKSSKTMKIDELVEQVNNKLLLDDDTGTEAMIVGKLGPNSRVVQTLPRKGESQFLLLDEDSKNSAEPHPTFNKIVPEIHTVIKIKKQRAINMPIASSKFFQHRVDEYTIVDKRANLIGQELVAVIEVKFGEATVVGRSLELPTLIPWYNFENALQSGDFLIGNVYRLKPFCKPKRMFKTICYIKDLEEERKYTLHMNKHIENRANIGLPPRPMTGFFMADVRTLSQDEKEMIGNNCRDVEDLTLEMAKLYIRDVYVSIARLEKFIRQKSIQQNTLKVIGTTKFDLSGSNKRIVLTVSLSEDEVERVIKKRSPDTWRVSTDLSIRHDELKRLINRKSMNYTKKYEAEMTIEKIYKDGKRMNVRFRPHPRSYDLFDILVNSNVTLEGLFEIGPSEDYIETIVDTLSSSNFDNFFSKRNLFDSWRGIRKNETVAIPDLDEAFDVNGSSLDESQTIALRTVIANPGFTCVEAPPGSGKTFLIVAMAAAKYQKCGPEMGTVCVSATTNNPISNAIDKIHECYSYMKVVREYSKKMEGEINDVAKEISLKEMALNAEKYIKLEEHKNVAKAIDQYHNCKSELKHGLALLDKLQRTDFDLKSSFQRAYCPYIVGTTCELMARRGDAFYNFAANEEDEKKMMELRKFAITHLVLDEASQLPPHLALAVYCSLPALKQITLIGDSEQLGPYTPLEEKTFAYKMVSTGELDRIGFGANKVYLKTVYRSHPRIVDLLLTPIYGKDLRVGRTASQRNLAQQKGLPCADDKHKTPVLFVNIEEASNNDRGVNTQELNVVLTFIETLRRKGMENEDVAVVCNHLAQREAIIAKLRGRGNIGILKTSVGIYTVDSFQGKEAKVVLILTTKTAQNPRSAAFAFQFVANPNRGCVAVSRGQHAVYLFGEWFNLVRTEFWSQFVDGIVESKAMVKSDWSPSTPEDYAKLKSIVAKSAPQNPTARNRTFGGGGLMSATHNNNNNNHNNNNHKANLQLIKKIQQPTGQRRKK